MAAAYISSFAEDKSSSAFLTYYAVDKDKNLKVQQFSRSDLWAAANKVVYMYVCVYVFALVLMKCVLVVRHDPAHASDRLW